jgi:5-methylcytosine-specific restriction protein B
MQTKHNVEIEQLVSIRSRFETLNVAIRDDATLGPEFMLGHSFVTPPAEERVDSYVNWFRTVVTTEIAPTLKEYWFEDPLLVEGEVSKLVEGLS